MTFKKILTHIVIPVFIVAAILAGYYVFGKIRAAEIYEETHSTVEEAIPEKSAETPASIPEPTTNYELQTTVVNLPIDFFSQAPYADWGMPYQEACEEASLILAYNYAQGIEMTKEEFHTELLRMVDWEIAYFGSYEHTTVDQTAEMLSEFYGFTNWKILEEVTAEDLKTELRSGNPIVAPFAGRMLGNPNFTGEGPYYHMLVIKGFDDNYFITNDVGTRLGENYQYTEGVLLSALHDWHDTDIANLGEKKVLVLIK